MEPHHELSSYLYGQDTARIAQALREMLEAEGMACVEAAEGWVPDVASDDCDVWRVAVVPGRGGWHFLLSAPEWLLGEARPDGAIRFAALSATLGAPGMLREAWYFERFVGTQGTVNLFADGQGRQCIAGQLYDYTADAPSADDTPPDGRPRWRGHAIDYGEDHEDPELWPALSALFPAEQERDPSRMTPELDAATAGLALAERLAGHGLDAYWREDGDAWRGLKAYLGHGENLPLAGALTLTFRRAGPARAWPAAAPAISPAAPPFRYNDGSDLRIGDRVRLQNGAEGDVVDLLGTMHRDAAQPRYAVVRAEGRSRMIKVTRVKRGDYRFATLARVRAATPPGAKPRRDDLQGLAERGDADAMAHLGFIHYVGDGRPRDPALSCHWLTAATALGHPDAGYRLAQHYRKAFEVAYSRERIQALAAAAYRHGSVEAAGLLIDHASPDTRLALIRQLAEQGNPIGQYELAWKLHWGGGIDKNQEEAFRLCELSANQGYPPAIAHMGWCYSYGEGVGRDSRCAAAWYRRAIDLGRDECCISMAALYLEGSGICRNTACAITLLEYAQSENIPGAGGLLETAWRWR